MDKINEAGQSTPDGICDTALKHYEALSTGRSWISTIPKAIEVYRKYLKKGIGELATVEGIEKIKEILFDLLEEHFPKGKCKERGQASVLVGEIMVVLQTRL